MDQSISVVLPVHNAEASLASHVAHILDVLPDLTSRFEILIVDNGSTDHTEESAQELARQFPQLRVVRHSRREGMSTLMKTSLAQAQGDVVLVQDPANLMLRDDLRQIQAVRIEAAKSKPSLPRTVGKLMVWGAGLQASGKSRTDEELVPHRHRPSEAK